ncbi:MAG: sulfite exporter TauE/SafE family protein [Dehalococcoidales bacterium]|nr:MAG: sulfite exporter TauE/SafE family protein [Dehalococcoidales bacterium]
MLQLPMMPDIEVSIVLLVILSLSAGVISGFVGVGGGFIMTPALIILGFPAQYAVGTDMLYVMGNSIIGTLRHRRLGNVDFKLGCVMIVFMMVGVEVGIRILNTAINAGIAEESVLIVTICVLIIVGSSIFWESTRTKARMEKMIRENNETDESTGISFISSALARVNIPPILNFPRANVRISLWVLLLIGVTAGVLAGFIGVGGGFIIVPSLVYVFGVPSFIAVGTSLFQIIFPAAFGAARYSIDGSVVIFAAFIMIFGSSVGVYFGSLLTRYLSDISMRYTLAITILVAVMGSIIKVVAITSDSEVSWLRYATMIITFGGLIFIICLLSGLYLAAIRKKKGKYIPAWTQSLIKD